MEDEVAAVAAVVAAIEAAIAAEGGPEPVRANGGRPRSDATSERSARRGRVAIRSKAAKPSASCCSLTLAAPVRS